MAYYPAQRRMINISIAVGIIDTAAVALRLFARKRSKAPFAIDDLLITLSLFPVYSMIGVSVLCKQRILFLQR